MLLGIVLFSLARTTIVWKVQPPVLQCIADRITRTSPRVVIAAEYC
jgi:hypothetical protein